MNSLACGGVNEVNFVSTPPPVRRKDGKEKKRIRELDLRKSADRRRTDFTNLREIPLPRRAKIRYVASGDHKTR